MVDTRLLEDDETVNDLRGMAITAVSSFPGLWISFQPPGLAAPDGYVCDNGEPLSLRSCDWEFGWAGPNIDGVRQRWWNNDALFDTLCIPDRWQEHEGRQMWQLRVPSGTYRVILGLGDAEYGGWSYCGLVNQVAFTTPPLQANIKHFRRGGSRRPSSVGS